MFWDTVFLLPKGKNQRVENLMEALCFGSSQSQKGFEFLYRLSLRGKTGSSQLLHEKDKKRVSINCVLTVPVDSLWGCLRLEELVMVSTGIRPATWKWRGFKRAVIGRQSSMCEVPQDAAVVPLLHALHRHAPLPILC